MIWVSDGGGGLTYVSPEWTTITGQKSTVALGNGWTSVVHPADLPIIEPIFRAAVAAKSQFSLLLRMRVFDGTYFWVVTGAVPSFDTEGVFIGYLGSITKVEPHDLTPLHSGGKLGSFEPPFPHNDTLTHQTLDLVADHLLIAYSLIKEDGGKPALPHLQMAMLKVAIELAKSGSTRPSLH